MKFSLRYLFIILSIFLLFYAASNTNAQTLTIKELQDKIEQTRLEKQRLEEENKKLEAQIDETGKQAQTLQNAVKSLDVTQKKLQNNIKVTETNISNTELTIKKVGIEIEDAENSISKDAEAIAESLRTLQQNEEQSLVETMLRYKDINDLWDTIETLKRFQSSLRTDLTSLKLLRDSLESKKTEHESKKQELVSYKSDLSDQKTVVEQNKSAKTVLLSQTKNKEAEYKKLLERNIELGRKFEQELFDYESRLQFQIDKSKLPGENSKVLSWPLNDIYITQRFGKTVDSKKLYVSGTHNGVDFRASMGTAVKSVADGVVQGMGNTDSQAGCYSYGRWLLIKHNNGLSSMYAHLSGIKVSQGDSIAKDQIIGWSGGQPGTSGAGYSTGPHLHLSLYATEGVSIEKYEQSIFCKQVYIPIAASNAYLDPLSYLPAL